MNDFKSYAENGKKSNGQRGGGQNKHNGQSSEQASGQSGNLNQTVNMATMLAKAFNGKSEGQVLQTIIAQAEQGKRDGTLTNADLDNFYNTLAPMLDSFKRQKLKSIITKLKNI